MKDVPGKIPFAPIVLLFKMVYKNGGVSFGRIPMLLIYVFRYVLLEPFRLAEIILYHKKIESHVLSEPPIFILGHWRSGTSFFQSLICQDTRMTSSTIFRSLFPDNFYLTESWLKPILTSICKFFNVPYSIQRVPMDLDLPAEVDMTLCSLCSERSYTWGQLFPRRFEKWVDELLILKNKNTADEWLHDYDYFIRKLSYRSKGKRVVVKSPGDTARIGHLLRHYPKASFIYIHRDPFSVFHSNLYFWRILQQQNSLQTISNTEVQDLIVNSYRKIMRSYLNQRDLVPISQLIELRFEEIIKDPLKELSRTYSALNIGTMPEKEITALLLKHQSQKYASYSITAELRDRLNREWDFVFEEWPA